MTLSSSAGPVLSQKKCSRVYVWPLPHAPLESTAVALAVHVVNHDDPVPNAALKVIAHAVEGIAAAKAEVQHRDIIVIHYLPRHQLIDLTLVDGTQTGKLDVFKAAAENEGIQPFLHLFLRTYRANVVDVDDGDRLTGELLVEVHYDSADELLKPETCTTVSHDMQLHGGVDSWLELLRMAERIGTLLSV